MRDVKQDFKQDTIVRIMDGEILEFLLRFYGMTYLFLLDKPNPLIILKKRLKTYLFVRHFR